MSNKRLAELVLMQLLGALGIAVGGLVYEVGQVGQALPLTLIALSGWLLGNVVAGFMESIAKTAQFLFALATRLRSIFAVNTNPQDSQEE